MHGDVQPQECRNEGHAAERHARKQPLEGGDGDDGCSRVGAGKLMGQGVGPRGRSPRRGRSRGTACLSAQSELGGRSGIQPLVSPAVIEDGAGERQEIQPSL